MLPRIRFAGEAGGTSGIVPPAFASGVFAFVLYFARGELVRDDVSVYIALFDFDIVVDRTVEHGGRKFLDHDSS